MATCIEVNAEVAACANLAAKRGDNLTFQVMFYTDDTLVTPLDISQFDEIRLQIKKRTTDAAALVEASLGDGLAVSGLSELRVDVPGERMNIQRSNYVYDVEGSDLTQVRTLLEGSIAISDDVTR